MALALSLTLCGACLLFWPAADVGFDRYHLPKELAVALGAALSTALSLRRQRLDGVSAAVLVFMVVAALSTAFATSPALALRGFGLTFSLCALFLAARTCDAEEARRVRLVVVAAVSVVALVALLEAFGAATGLSSRGRAPGAVIGQRNAVAHLLLLVCPAAWTLASKAEGRRRAVLLGLCALLAGGIVVTRSRAAWVTAPVVLSVWLVCGRRWRHGAPAVVAATLAAAAVAVAPARLEWSHANPYRDTLLRLVDVERGSGLGRLTQYRASAGLIGQHPGLGAGPGNWLVEYPKVSPPGDPTFRTDAWLSTGRLVNSDHVALAVEYGLLALVAVAALLFLMLRSSLKPLPTLVALLGVSALDAVLQLPSAGACAAVLLGLSCRTGAGQGAAARRWVPASVAVLCAVAALLAGLRLIGLGFRLRGGFDGYETALQWNPADLQARTSLTEAYQLEDGDCRRAGPHVQVLARQLPNHPGIRAMVAACSRVPTP